MDWIIFYIQILLLFVFVRRICPGQNKYSDKYLISPQKIFTAASHKIRFGEKLYHDFRQDYTYSVAFK